MHDLSFCLSLIYVALGVALLVAASRTPRDDGAQMRIREAMLACAIGLNALATVASKLSDFAGLLGSSVVAFAFVFIGGRLYFRRRCAKNSIS
jgi:acyl dehydratase